LMGDLLASPPAFGNDNQIIVVAILIDVPRHLECRFLKRTRSALITRRLQVAPVSTEESFESRLVSRPLSKKIEDRLRGHPPYEMVIQARRTEQNCEQLCN